MKNSERLVQLNAIVQKHCAGDSEYTNLFDKLKKDISDLERQIEILSLAGAELNRVQDQSSVLEIILDTARELTNADGGTVYIIVEEYHDDPYNPGRIKARYLSFEVLQTESLNIFEHNSNGKQISLPPVPLEVDGKPNHSNVSAYCANTGWIVNIPDVYHAEGFDFSGPKKYDQKTGYRSQSMLVIPLRDHENQINGVLQLLNRKLPDGTVVPFTSNDQAIVQSLSYQTAVSLTTQKLLKEQVRLFESFVQVLAEGLGEKSPYTFSHINRVAHLTTEMAKAVDEFDQGIYKNIHFNSDHYEELKLAGWMHDIGKLTTPEHIVSKSVKLQVIHDRFEIIVERFNSKIKDVEIDFLEKKIKAMEEQKDAEFLARLEEEKELQIEALNQALQILCRSNVGGEFLTEENEQQIKESSQTTMRQHFDVQKKVIFDEERIIGIGFHEKTIETPLINEEEEKLLLIQRGTLSESERKVINDHADRSWRWLMKLPFPRKMKMLPLYAAAHHETLIGTGYPNQLEANQLPIQSRIIAIVDVFEALTAKDRPYKDPMPLSRSMQILGFLVKDGLIDAEVIRIFLKSGLYMEYARQFLNEDQIDDFDVDQWIEKFYPKEFTDTLPKYDSQTPEKPLQEDL